MTRPTKTCPRCKLVPRLPSSSYCLVCKREYERERWEADKDRNHIRKNNARILRARESRCLINDIKTKDPCMDCGKRYPYYVMHFDHLDHSKKKNNISDLVHGSVSMTTLLEEIEKCEVVCANCHAERTNNRGYQGHRNAEIREVELRGRAQKIVDQNGVVYRSQKEASLKLGIKQSGISRVLHKKAKSCKGFSFTYAPQS